MNTHVLTHYECITKKGWIKNLRALRHKQRRHYECLLQYPFCYSKWQQLGEWLQLTGGSIHTAWNWFRNVESCQWDMKRGFLVASGCLSFLLRERQTFSSLQNIWFLPGNHHTTTRKILPWYKASIMDGVEQCKESESLVSSLKYWITNPKAQCASGLPVLLS